VFSSIYVQTPTEEGWQQIAHRCVGSSPLPQRIMFTEPRSPLCERPEFTSSPLESFEMDWNAECALLQSPPPLPFYTEQTIVTLDLQPVSPVDMPSFQPERTVTFTDTASSVTSPSMSYLSDMDSVASGYTASAQFMPLMQQEEPSCSQSVSIVDPGEIVSSVRKEMRRSYNREYQKMRRARRAAAKQRKKEADAKKIEEEDRKTAEKHEDQLEDQYLNQ